jgi:hypothetical protein
VSAISDYTADLIAKLNTVPEFGGRVAATLGGTEADPALANIELPFAWVVLAGTQNVGEANQRWQMMSLDFSVTVAMRYGDGEADFVETQLKLLDDAAQAVRGEVTAQGSHLWSFDGLTYITNNVDRVLYGLNFSAPAAYAKQPT